MPRPHQAHARLRHPSRPESGRQLGASAGIAAATTTDSSTVMALSSSGTSSSAPTPNLTQPQPSKSATPTYTENLTGPASPGPFGHVDELTEPRGRHARLDADHLEVLERPNLPSADFFHTRNSTAASPKAWVRSATSASSCCSRVEGPDRPAANAVLPASRSRPSTARSTAR